MNVKVLPRAIRSRHYAVASSIVGSLLIKLLIIISTGLVASQDVAFRKQSTVVTQAFTVPDTFDGEKVDSRPSLNVEGIIRTGLYPFGSTLEHAFQPFAAPPGVNLGNSPHNCLMLDFLAYLFRSTADSSSYGGCLLS